MNTGKIMMIKKYSIGILLLVLFSKAEWTFAQNFRASGRSNMDTRSNFNNNNNINNSAGMHRIESIKLNYLTEKMNLSSDESDRFRPIYNQYQSELSTILHLKRQNMRNSQKSSQDIINDNFDYDSKILSIKKRYNQEFSRVLPPDKLKQLWISEREFNEEMIQRLKNRHGNDE